jgi:regulator of sigma E protease
VPVVVERDGARRTLELTPRYDSDLERFRFGFAFTGADYVSADLSLGQSADWALDRMWFVTERTVSIIANIFDAEQRKQISGIVGSYEVTRQSIEFDTRQALGVLGLISLSLAVINLFPFLPLDGGHIFWSLVEKVRGRPVPFSVMERASVVGFVLVLMLFAIGLSNDIDRLTGEGFDVR